MAPEGKRGGKAYEGGGGGGGGGGTLYLGLASLLLILPLLVVWTLAAAASLSRRREEGTNDNSSLNCRRVHCLTKVGEAPLLPPFCKREPSSSFSAGGKRKGKISSLTLKGGREADAPTHFPT